MSKSSTLEVMIFIGGYDFEWDISTEYKSSDIQSELQLGTNILERLLNKAYVNEVTLRGQISPLKCC